MRAWGMAAVLLLAACAAGCGGNSTVVGITITGPGLQPLTIIVGQPAQVTATVTGVSTTTVFWQICEPLSPPSTVNPPTMCTQGQGPSGCTIPTVSSPITGFGTITANGLYTAPATVPSPAKLQIVATSCIRTKSFALFNITIDSGIRVQVNPVAASMGPGEHFQFTDIVTGTNDTGVVWMVNGIPGGDQAHGFICPNQAAVQCNTGSPGEYFSPNAAGTFTIAAQSGADPAKQGAATVVVASTTAPTISGIEPSVAAQGSVQQDVYISGTNFFSTTQVFVNNVAVPPANVTLISAALMRVTIPGAQLTLAGLANVALESQDGQNSSGPVNLHVAPVRPVVIASTPHSVQLNNGNAALTAQLTGGYFLPNTIPTFNGVGCGGGGQVCASYVDSRHLNVSIQDGTLGSPGLYQLLVENPDALAAAPPVPAFSGLNLAVNPNPSTISTSPGSPVGVGAAPSAIAIDSADGIAVVANKTDGTVTLINVNTHGVIATIAVGAAPTGVAVDDMLQPHHTAYVVNSGDASVSVIDLTTHAVSTLSLTTYEPSLIPMGTVPWTIGVNPLTHRAFIANQSTNVGTILDLVNPNANLSTPCATPPCPVGVITGGITPYGTGPNPQVAVDPRLNWAMVTPGGAGTTSIIDLGRAPATGDVGRRPELIGSLSISSTMQGIAINAETHEALLADPARTTLTTFSLMNDAVTSVTFRSSGTVISTPNLAAAAVTPLENLGVAIPNTGGSKGVIADMNSGVVLGEINGLGSPTAVAVDPATNQALIVDGTANTVSFLSLGTAPAQPQILEASPANTMTNDPVTLVLTGANFAVNSVIRLDQGNAAIGGFTLPATATGCSGGVCRQLTATIPANTLTSARRYLVDVQNGASGPVSNLTDLAVIQAIPVGTTPIGIAVDTIRDSAVVTNSIDNTASILSLTPVAPAFSPESLGPIGVFGTVNTGGTPEGVAIDPRLGIAVVANNGSDNVTVVDEINAFAPGPISLCGSSCTGPTGVAINPDTSVAVITNTNSNTLFTNGEVALLSLSRGASVSGTLGAFLAVDQDPVAVAVDPKLNFAGVATASSTSSFDIISLSSSSIVNRVNNLQNPSGVVFDPVNQIFITVNSLLNNLVFTDPASANSTVANVGIAPTSVDYNFQTSSLVTVNSGSHTMSVLDYTCPPNAGPTCFVPQVRDVLTLGGAQTSTLVLGPNAVAIDPKLNLAVLVDPDNNRVLLVPLPH